MSRIDEIEKRLNAGEDLTIDPDGTVRAATAEEVAAREADVKRAQEKLAAKERKPILCLDFDGVIHSYTSGWKGADVIPDPPVPGAFKFIGEALEAFRVAIFSSRSNQSGGLKAMQAWFDDHARYEPWLSLLEWPVEKPAAMITIDDRALTFDGTWPSIDELRDFQPWNKRQTTPADPVGDGLTELKALANEEGRAAAEAKRRT